MTAVRDVSMDKIDCFNRQKAVFNRANIYYKFKLMGNALMQYFV